MSNKNSTINNFSPIIYTVKTTINNKTNKNFYTMNDHKTMSSDIIDSITYKISLKLFIYVVEKIINFIKGVFFSINFFEYFLSDIFF